MAGPVGYSSLAYLSGINNIPAILLPSFLLDKLMDSAIVPAETLALFLLERTHDSRFVA
jgi:hypothetical protein